MDALVAIFGRLMRVLLAAILAIVAAFNVAGFAFLAFAWFIDLDIHVRGGALTVVLGVAVTTLCFLGIRSLHPLSSVQA